MFKIKETNSNFTDVNECTNNDAACHATLATCTNIDGGYTCACNPGYTGNGIDCTGNYYVNVT